MVLCWLVYAEFFDGIGRNRTPILGLKIMVSPVRFRVSPLPFYKYLQDKCSPLRARLYIEYCFYHSRYHNGHSLEMPREEIVESHGGFAVHGGGDVSVGAGGLFYGGVSQHLRDQLELLLVLEHEGGKGVPEVVETNVFQPKKRRSLYTGASGPPPGSVGSLASSSSAPAYLYTTTTCGENAGLLNRLYRALGRS
jgi:hypothetical protein